MTTQEQSPVVIIGAGVAGLTLATMLNASGVACVLLERRDREYVQGRQRAGVVDGRNVRMFERWNLADRLLAGPVAQTIDYRIDGHGRVFTLLGEDQAEGRFCTQQMLVNNLLRVLVDELRADVRFGVSDVLISNHHQDGSPSVSYIDASGEHILSCLHIAGCDADRGVSRASIPEGALTTITHDFGYAWLAALVEAPLKEHPIMGVSRHGFIGQLPRGPRRSRYYLQCALEDSLEDWTDERLWNEIRLRTGDNALPNARVIDKEIVPLRSVVHTPMQYGQLYLAGDAAHLVPPTGAKGMNMALFDVDMLAQALISAVRDKDLAGLVSYTDTVLPHTWRYQEFSAWMTDTMHDAGDPSLHGHFRQATARARLDALFEVSTASRLHTEYQRGLA